MSKTILGIVTTVLLAGPSVYAEIKTARETGGTMAPKAIVINFSNLGAGLDEVVKEGIDSIVIEAVESGLVKEFKKQEKLQGEITYCIEFSEWNYLLEYERSIYDVLKTARIPNQTKMYRFLDCSRY